MMTHDITNVKIHSRTLRQIEEDMLIEIFGKTQCPFCDKAKYLSQLAKDEYPEHVEFTYKQLDKDFTREELFEQFPTARTFPQVRIDGEAIGGYEQFSDYLEMLPYD
jgi:glutaredoxin 3